MALVDALAEEFAGQEKVRSMFDQVRAAARADGIELDFDVAVQANTFDAHRLLTWAEATGGPGAQRDLAHELWRAHFAEGADVGDNDTLAVAGGDRPCPRHQ
ncbi:MAG: DsbA family protein [Mycobacteriales bacterium]